MKNFSLPRTALILWFLNYTFFSIVLGYIMGNGRHEIAPFILYAAVWTALELFCLGLIEDKL